MINKQKMDPLDNRKFKLLSNSSNGEVSEETIFYFKQTRNIISAHYSGGGVSYGHLLGTIDSHGSINMRYHHMNLAGELMTGKSDSKLVTLASGKYQIHDQWQWTSGDLSSGTSILEEL